MKDIKLEDLEIIPNRRGPKFLGMKKEDIYDIRYYSGYIIGYDKNGNEIYYEDFEGFWCKTEYDKNGKEIYFENSRGYWCKTEYDNNGNEIYTEDSKGNWKKTEYYNNGKEVYSIDSKGYWYKLKYDDNGNEIYYEDCEGNWYKIEDGKEIEYEDGKYYVDGQEARLKK